MSLVWPATEQDIILDQPRLHALVIGVGDYPHLNGGSGPLAADPLYLWQITTPRFTAPAIAEWLLGEYCNPACRLGSVEVLLSPAAQIALPGGGQTDAQRATMSNVKQSFAAWQVRCSKQAGNIAFFYFCGHGLHKGAQFLLAEDFGNPALQKRWENCIDFDGMRVGMRSCLAQTQLFFVDACRETPFGLLTQLQIQGDPLIDGASISDTVRCSAAYYATAQGQQAYGPADGVTYFGQAVLSCLNGVGRREKRVDSYSLGYALGQVMAQMARRHQLPLTCHPDVTGMAEIHEPKAPSDTEDIEAISAPTHFRIFLATPDDVAQERGLALQVLDQLRYDPSLGRRVTIEAVAWDKPGPVFPVMTTLADIAAGWPKPAECDIVVLVLWSLMGTRLLDEDRKADGTPYLFEWEYLNALEAAERSGKPAILVYRRREKCVLDQDDPVYEEKRIQYLRVKTFFNPGGSITRDCHEYPDPEDFRQQLEKDLKKVIASRLKEGDVSRAPPFPAAVPMPSAPLWSGSPFPGLREFIPGEAPIFFGRDREANELVRRLADGSRFLVIMGASGSGKSSLVAAGLLPLLMKDAIPGAKDWLLPKAFPPERPGERSQWVGLRFTPDESGINPFQALAAKLAPLLPDEAMTLDRVTKELEDNPRALAALAEKALQKRPHGAEALLFIDQFEQLIDVAECHRTPFIVMLAEAAQTSWLRIIVTIRADSYHRWLEVPGLPKALRAAPYFLVAPSRDDLCRMIAGPAARAGLDFDEGLVDCILEDTGTSPGALALLAFALQELYQARTPQGKLTFDAYKNIEGVKGAIGRCARSALNKLPAEVQADLPEMFSKLVDVKAGIFTRGRVLRSNLNKLDRLVNAFTNARLLVTDRGPAGEAVVELAHDALFESWTELKDWVEQRRKALERLASAERELSRDPLRSARDALPALDDPSTADRAFHVLQRAVQALRMSGWERKFEKDAVVHAIAYRPPTGEWLATACADGKVRLWNTQSASDECRAFSNDDDVPKDPSPEVFGVAFSPDGKRLATADGNGTVILFNFENLLDVENEKPVPIWRKAGEVGPEKIKIWADKETVTGHRDRVNSIVYSPDGKHLLTASDDGTAIIWDADSGNLDFALQGHRDKVNWAVFSPDGKRIATASWDKTARVWDVDTGDSFPLKGHRGVVNGVDFSHYGGRLATASWDGTVKVWDSESRTDVRTFSVGKGGFTRVMFDKEGGHIATAGQDWTARIWDIESGRELLTLPFHNGIVNAIAYSPDAKHLASAGWDKSVKLWSVAPRGHKDLITSIEFCQDGEHVATGSRDGTATIWSIRTGAEVLEECCNPSIQLRLQPLRPNTILAVTFDPATNALVTASWRGRETDWIAWAWDREKRAQSRWHCWCPTGRVMAATFIPDRPECLLTIDEKQQVTVWERPAKPDSSQAQAKKRWSATIDKMRIIERALSADGNLLAVAGSDPEVVIVISLEELWNSSNGKIEYLPELETGHKQLIKGLAFSRKDRHLATASVDGTVKFFRKTPDGFNEPHTFKYEGTDDAPCPVDEVALSEDSQKLAATGFDGTLRVWDISKPEEPLFRYSDPVARLSGVAFSPRGECLVGIAMDGTLQFYDLKANSLRETASDLLRKLSPDRTD